MKNKTKIFFVYDGGIFQKTLKIEFREQANYDIATFSTGEDCFKK